MREHYLKMELYDKLKKNPEIFDFFQETIADGIWYMDLENPGHEWMSPKFWETLGYDPKEKKHLSSEWQSLVEPEDLIMAKKTMEKHMKNPNQPFDETARYRHKDGSTLWLRSRGVVLQNEKGIPSRMLGAHINVTEEKIKEAEVTLLKKEFETVFHGTQDAMFLLKVQGPEDFTFLMINSAFQEKTGLSLSTIQNNSLDKLECKELYQRLLKNSQGCVQRNQSITYEEEVPLPSGKALWLTTLSPITEGGRVEYIVGSSLDITLQRTMEKELEKRANYDKLTGLPNRYLFFDRLETLMKKTRRENKAFGLLYLDLDEFKKINDRFGHDKGDEVLSNVAKAMVDSLRESDTIARMGGDEFSIILPNVLSKKNLREVAEKIYQNIKARLLSQMGFHDFEVSIGGVLSTPEIEKAQELLKKADAAMYRVKNTQGGGYEIVSY